MSRTIDLEKAKVLTRMLLSSFAGSFIGAAWVAYGAIKFGASGSFWLPLSAVGAMTVCLMMLALSRPTARGQILN